MKVLVIGGGIFGCCAAYVISGKNFEVDLIEQDTTLMNSASKVNHNRLHLGYHYLRSIETANQSIEGMLSFLFHFWNSVRYQFPNYYAIAKNKSATSPNKFIKFCDSVGIGYEEEFPKNNLLNRDLIDMSFRVPEPVFDYTTIKKTIISNLKHKKVKVMLKTHCDSLKRQTDNVFAATFNGKTHFYDVVINATYSSINEINHHLQLPKTKLLYEDVIIPEFKFVNEPIGLTIMDGPFCSVMPKGFQNNKFLLYHVKESVLQSSIKYKKPDFIKNTESDIRLLEKTQIYKKSSIYMPFLKNVSPSGLGRTTRVVYENSNDARITELHTFNNVKNYFSILSGKITTCIQVGLEIKHILQEKQTKKRFRI